MALQEQKSLRARQTVKSLAQQKSIKVPTEVNGTRILPKVRKKEHNKRMAAIDEQARES